MNWPFKLLATTTVGEPFAAAGLAPLRSGARFEVTVPALEAQAKFYKVAVSAR